MSINLVKGQKISLRKTGGDSLTNVCVGLGWDPVKEPQGGKGFFNRILHAVTHETPQAIDCGADMAAQSTHKILGAMTQASMLLVNGVRVDRERVREADAAKAALDEVQSMNLPELLIVSQALIGGDVPADAVTGTGTNFPGLHISVRNAPGVKCPRCWMHSEQADPETGLCPRCAAVVAAQQAE